MNEIDEECYYSCIGCGNMMKREGDMLICPVCGCEVKEDEYYDQIPNMQKALSLEEEEEEEADENGILNVDFNQFYSY